MDDTVRAEADSIGVISAKTLNATADKARTGFVNFIVLVPLIADSLSMLIVYPLGMECKSSRATNLN